MDGVSTAISLFSSGYTACQKVREIRQAIKDAPDQLDSLEHSCAFTEQLLDDVKIASSCLPTHNNSHHLKRTCERAQRHFEEVQKIADKVTKGCSSDEESNGERKIRRMKWILHKESIERMEAEMKELQNTLGILLVSAQQHYFTLLLTEVGDVKNALTTQSQGSPSFEAAHGHSADDPAPINTRNGELDEDYDTVCRTVCTIGSSHARSNDPLRCPPQCECRCHYPSLIRLLPTWLAVYTGQISISNRLLRSPPPCNVQTCRGDPQRASTVQWILPAGFLQGCLQSSRYPGRIHFLIGAPRIVPIDTPIRSAIMNGDFEYVHDLFKTGQASIWDYTASGMPVFWGACNWWQRNPNEDRLKIIRLFIEAGADALLFEETPTTYSAHDLLTIGFFKYLLDGASDESRSLATIVRTNAAAIDIFRSLFNIDPMDALEDYLNRKRARYIDITGFLAWLEDTRSNPATRSSVVKVTGYTPLGYAIKFSPENVESLLARGENAAVEPTLAYAISSGNSFLVKFLLDAGANINMRNWRGYTALHSACSQCYYSGFLELLQWAEDVIDWDICTPEGLNALELFDLAISAGWAKNLSESEIHEFRAQLVAHIDPVVYESDILLDIPGAF